MKKLIALSLLTAGLAACGSDDKDNPLGPVDRAECTVGTLTVGQTRDFNLGAGTGCKSLDIWNSTSATPANDSVYTASFTVRLNAGTTYSFKAMDQANSSSGLDITMALFGPGADTSEYGWLTASDDDGGGASGLNSQIIFTPKVTGNYAVRVSGYGTDDVGAVRLYSATCPFGGVIAGASASGTLTAGGCTVQSSSGMWLNGDSTRVVAYQFALPAGASRVVSVTSSAFQPSILVVGPGPDLWYTGSANLVWENNLATADVASVSFTTPTAGTYTLLVGSGDYGDTGAFTVNISTPAAGAMLVQEPTISRAAERRLAKSKR